LNALGEAQLFRQRLRGLGKSYAGSFYRILGSEIYSVVNETESLFARRQAMKFEYHNPTRLIFGSGFLSRLGEFAQQYGKSAHCW
jgi:hypothetical protein